MIFQRAEEGKFDLKLEFRNNPYQVYTYRLFALGPIEWNIDNPQNINITYHKGADGRPIMIHLKDETKEGKDKYRTLPATRLQAPNVNQMFPIPLVKFEFPRNLIKRASDYEPKPYHHLLDINTSNVIEIYLASEKFDINAYFNNAYGTLMSSQLMLSMEYFSSCSVLSDYAKSEHFVPKGEPEIRFKEVGGIPGMKLFVNCYNVPLFDERWNNIHVTFCDNALAEEILLCTKIAYPKINSNPFEYDCIYLGGPTLEQLRPPVGPLTKIPVMCNTTVLRCLESNEIPLENRKELEIQSGKARVTLYNEMKHFEENLNKEKETYRNKAQIFLAGMEQLRQIVRAKVEEHCRDNILYMNDVEGWILSDESVTAEGIYYLFAKFLGLEDISLFRMRIKSKKYKQKREHKSIKYEDGIPIYEAKHITVDNTIFNHIWMELDDMLEIDLFRGNLNMFLEQKGWDQEPEIFFSRTKPHFKDDGWDGMRDKLKSCGFECVGPQTNHCDYKKMEEIFLANNGLLNKVYAALTKVLEKVEGV